jgi:hypothetical protein
VVDEDLPFVGELAGYDRSVVLNRGCQDPAVGQLGKPVVGGPGGEYLGEELVELVPVAGTGWAGGNPLNPWRLLIMVGGRATCAPRARAGRSFLPDASGW